MPEAILDIPLHDTTRSRYLNYALSVITSRALPDVRDGLKPVQRRILYAMFHNLRLMPDTKYRKSAAVVGEVMAKYHPHGDQSIYDAMVRLAQDFSLRYPLVDGQGNFGSVDGDRAAAMRYTESRLRHLAVELLSEIRKETVDYRANYDGTITEPVVLPAQAPNLLINGATGIAVGMATSIPPHNLKEVVGACIALIDNPELPLERVVPRFVRGPDFPTGGEILNDRESILEIYRTGRGPIDLRGTFELEKEGRSRQIVITSIPYALDKSALVTEIAEHIRTGKVPQIIDIRDESTEDVRVVLELKHRANPDAAMAYLFRRTKLQSRFNVNLTALCPTDDPQVARPDRLDLLRILRSFLDFRFDVTVRRLQYDLAQLERRIHILEGFEIIFNALDEAISLIRHSEGKSDARDRLMKRFELDWEQAEAILETKLYRLARLEIDAIQQELDDKRTEAARIRAILASEAETWALVRSELKEIREAYGDRRRTRITGPVEAVSFSDEVYIVREDAFVIVTRRGWFKRQKSYTDLSAIRLPSDDEVGWVVPASSRESLILFTDRGRAYTMRVADVTQTTGYGEAIQTRFDFKDRERVVGVATTDKRVLPRVPAELMAEVAEGDPKPPYLTAISKAGKCLRLSLDAYAEPSTRSGRLYMRMEKRFKGGDAVIGVVVGHGTEMVSLASHQSRALVFPVAEINVLSGPGKGVMAMKLAKGDHVVGFKLVLQRMDGVEVTTNRGKVEVVRPNKFKPSARAGKGREIVKKGHIASVKLEPMEWRFPEGDPEEGEEGLMEAEADAFDAALERAKEEGEHTMRPTTPIPLEPPSTSLAAGASGAFEALEIERIEEKTVTDTVADPVTDAVTDTDAVAVTDTVTDTKPKKKKPTRKRRAKKSPPAAEPAAAEPAAAEPAPAEPPAGPEPEVLAVEPLLTPPTPSPESLPRDPEEDDADRLPRLDRIAKMAADRFARRKRKKPDDDPNQGSLF